MIFLTKLEIKNLHVEIEGKKILKGINLTISSPEVHAIMGPNGSGKSTLANVIMGHPRYEVTKGEILFNDKSILDLEPDERAKLGLFLSFQYPMEVEGLPFNTFLQEANKSLHPKTEQTLMEFKKLIKEKSKELGLKEDLPQRDLNVGFSGGEKKRAEILQMLTLKSKMAILDETDSGLDIDSLKFVSDAVNSVRGGEFGALVITHYVRILNHLKPDFVHVLVDGKIVASGDKKLADELDEKGYVKFLAEQGIEIKNEELL